VTGPARIHAVDCSPDGGGRTQAAVAAVAAAAAGAGATVDRSWVGGAERSLDSTLAALNKADAVIIGSPVYRASYATPLKRLLDAIPRDTERRESVLAGKAVAIVLVAASWHHFLALGGLRDVLAGFFAAHVLPPGLYVPRDGFDGALALREPFSTDAALLGGALVEAIGLLAGSHHLHRLRPQA